MKKYLWTLFILLLAGTSCQKKIDIEKEKEAVIAVNEEERNAFFDQDIARLEAIWIQKSTTQRIFRGDDRLTILNGWTEIYNNYNEDIESDWLEESENISASFANYKVNIYNNTALVYHDIHWTGKYLGEDIDLKQKRIVHFEKVDGIWKLDLIVQLTVPSEKEEIEAEAETEETE